MKPDAERHKNTNEEMSMSKAKYHVPQPGEMVEFTTKRGLRARATVSSWDAKHGIILSINGLHYAVGDRSTIKLVAPAPTATPKPIKADAPDPGKSAHRRPTVGDWVKVVNHPSSTGFVGKIVEDDHLALPYLVRIPYGRSSLWLRENQVKLTDKRPTDAPAPVADAPEPRPRTEEHLFREPVAVSTEFTARLPTSFVSEVARAQAIADAEAENKTRHETTLTKSEELSNKIAALVSERRDVMAEDENAQHDFENRLEYLRSLRVRQDR